MVDCEGETWTEPEVAPPVENPLPVQEVALEEDQESVAGCPCVMLLGLRESVAVGGALVTVTLVEA